MEVYKYKMYKNIELRKVSYFKIPLNINVKYYYDNGFNISINNNKDYIDLYIQNKDGLENQILINNEYDYFIDFNGIEEQDLNLVLYVYIYKEEKQIYKEMVSLNKIKKLTFTKDGEYIKLALRVYGNGNGKINNIVIKRKKNIKYITHNEILELGYNKPESIKKLKIACILDAFTMNCYDEICELIKVTPDTWKIDLEINKPNLLLVESAWYGNNNSWENKIQCKNENNLTPLKDVIKWCKENKVPTVFWNKEDPVHYNHFIKSAQLFDYIFTTDELSIKKYKNDLNIEHVYALPFAAQPKIHNPIKIYDKRIEKACFAGSFYNNKYRERKESLENLLSVARDSIGLEIYDRNYNNPNIQYKFPKEFNDYIKGYLKPNELDKCNKGYKIMLNTNSITDSPTMFSRRVFEGLACGTPVVSSYSRGIKEIFKDLVVSSDDIKVLKEEILKLKEEAYYDKKVVLGIREVMKHHTYEQRLEFILEKIGMNLKGKEKKLCIISKINSIEEFNKIKLIYKKQTYNYKCLCIIVSSEELYKDIKYCSQDITLILTNINNCKANINDYVKCDYIGFLNPNNYYFENYFEDMLNATLYTDAEFIGKKSFFLACGKNNVNLINRGCEYQYVDILDLDKCIIKSKVINNESISEILQYLDINYIDKFKFGYRYFSVDKYNLLEQDYLIDVDKRYLYKI